MEIAALQGATVGDLRLRWAERFRSEAPPIQSADVLLRLMAWRIQAEVSGDLDRETRQRIAALEKRVARGDPALPVQTEIFAPGMVLARDWRGTRHKVTVVEDGFLHEGTVHPTLSGVACAITGTHWSGPRFFGVEAKPGARKAQKRQSLPAKAPV